jgi:hypothetical protein
MTGWTDSGRTTSYFGSITVTVGFADDRFDWALTRVGDHG